MTISVTRYRLLLLQLHHLHLQVLLVLHLLFLQSPYVHAYQQQQYRLFHGGFCSAPTVSVFMFFFHVFLLATVSIPVARPEQNRVRKSSVNKRLCCYCKIDQKSACRRRHERLQDQRANVRGAWHAKHKHPPPPTHPIEYPPIRKK